MACGLEALHASEPLRATCGRSIGLAFGDSGLGPTKSVCPPTLCLPDSKAHSACLCDCPLRRAVSSVQEARIQRVLDFLKAPSQLSDKDLAAKVCLLCSLPTTSIKLSLCSQLLSKCIYLVAFFMLAMCE